MGCEVLPLRKSKALKTLPNAFLHSQAVRNRAWTLLTVVPDRQVLQCALQNLMYTTQVFRVTASQPQETSYIVLVFPSTAKSVEAPVS